MKTILRGAFMLSLLAGFVLAQWQLSLSINSDPQSNGLAWFGGGWLVLCMYGVFATGSMELTWANKTNSDLGVVMCGVLAAVISALSASALSFADWRTISAWVVIPLAVAGIVWWAVLQLVARFEKHVNEG